MISGLGWGNTSGPESRSGLRSRGLRWGRHRGCIQRVAALGRGGIARQEPSRLANRRTEAFVRRSLARWFTMSENARRSKEWNYGTVPWKCPNALFPSISVGGRSRFEGFPEFGDTRILPTKICKYLGSPVIFSLAWLSKDGSRGSEYSGPIEAILLFRPL
jgi:hypothetical protein